MEHQQQSINRPPGGYYRVALVVEYQGTNYAGFQLQVGQPTIQGELEKALSSFTGESIRVRGASRTDSGAHALGQVVDFLTCCKHPVDFFPRALNYYLPDDIKVQSAFLAPPEFNSRRNAVGRVYRYCILNRPWPSPLRRHTHYWVKEPLDVDRMQAAAQYLVGCHDFRPLAAGLPPHQSGVRRVKQWDVRREGDTVVIECQANGFLRHQIRRANGLLVEIGKGKQPESAMQGMLEGRSPQGREYPSLPARGLCLIRVIYPESWAQVGTNNETD